MSDPISPENKEQLLDELASIQELLDESSDLEIDLDAIPVLNDVIQEQTEESTEASKAVESDLEQTLSEGTDSALTEQSFEESLDELEIDLDDDSILATGDDFEFELTEDQDFEIELAEESSDSEQTDLSEADLQTEHPALAEESPYDTSDEDSDLDLGLDLDLERLDEELGGEIPTFTLPDTDSSPSPSLFDQSPRESISEDDTSAESTQELEPLESASEETEPEEPSEVEEAQTEASQSAETVEEIIDALVAEALPKIESQLREKLLQTDISTLSRWLNERGS